MVSTVDTGGPVDMVSGWLRAAARFRGKSTSRCNTQKSAGQTRRPAAECNTYNSIAPIYTAAYFSGRESRRELSRLKMEKTRDLQTIQTIQSRLVMRSFRAHFLRHQHRLQTTLTILSFSFFRGQDVNCGRLDHWGFDLRLFLSMWCSLGSAEEAGLAAPNDGRRMDGEDIWLWVLTQKQIIWLFTLPASLPVRIIDPNDRNVEWITKYLDEQEWESRYCNVRLNLSPSLLILEGITGDISGALVGYWTNGLDLEIRG